MKLAQCNKRRRYGKILHESSGKPGPVFSRSADHTAKQVHWHMEDTTETASGDANKYYQLDVPFNEMVDLIGGTLALMMRDDRSEEWEVKVARVRAALESLGLT